MEQSLLSADPGMQSSASAQQALRQYGIPLWNTEEFSTFSDESGALCWIRAVVDDYVSGYMTMTSSWYLVSGAYPSTPCECDNQQLLFSRSWFDPRSLVIARSLVRGDADGVGALGGELQSQPTGLGDRALHAVSAPSRGG